VARANVVAARKSHGLCVVLLVSLAVAWTSRPLADDAENQPESPPTGFGTKLKRDFTGFYGEEGLPPLLVGFGAAAVIANSSMDQNFRDWYQDSVRNDTIDGFAETTKIFGEGHFVIPVTLGGYLYSRIAHKPSSIVGQWSERSLRGFIVGTPALLFLQEAAGASRPSDGMGSKWDPFAGTEGASGHAFVAAVPFVTGAKMARKKMLKVALYFASTLTAWSRINDDRHYLSQAALGWWIGYLSAAAVNRTEHAKSVQLVPYAMSGGIGVLARIRVGGGSTSPETRFSDAS